MAEFHELVAWSRLSDICEKYVRKGKLLYIEGYLKTRSWDTPEGVKKFKTEVIVQDLIMLEKRGQDEDDYIPATEQPMIENASIEAPEEETEEKTEKEEVAEETPVEEPIEEDASEEKKTEKEEKEEKEEDDKADIDMDLGL